MNNMKLAFLTLPLVALLNGCVASSNFYSGRTLEEGKVAIAVGADDIILKSSDPAVTVEKGKGFAPSFGAAVGLPWRFELGARYFPTNFLELSLRDQINPRDFDIINASVNLHYGLLFGYYSYFKYGVTISKNIAEFEPYVHYAAYRFLGSTTSIFDDSFLSGVEEEFINNNRVIGFGIGLPIRSAKFFPEANYQYFGNDLSHGIWHFGIGLRVYTK